MTPDLATRALELVSIPSISHDEAAAAAYVAEIMPGEPVYADDLSTVYASRTGKPVVLFAGHLDTVPPQDNLPGRLEDGWVVGLGASDMKGGVAVMIELARWLAAEQPDAAVDAAFLFFPREEVGFEWNPLPGLFESCPLLREAELAVLLEPTDETIQAGCTGSLVARRVFTGKSAHSARPWLGDNAIIRAAEGIHAYEPVEVDVEGLRLARKRPRGAAPRSRRVCGRAQAGVDERGGLHLPRRRRDQPRPRGDTLRAHARGARRGCGDGTCIRGAATLPARRYGLRPCASPRS